MRKLVILLACFLFVFPVLAQPAFGCGGGIGLSVASDRVDAGGFAPRLIKGDKNQFDCIANRDPYFATRRFTSATLATNYWLELLGKEWGVSIGLIPTS